ncbi:uncharacterized protein N7477_004198 [Penicillium maclennaniae]|uniref:uncharacterized protein n=1 Tax=Penicillium maclennaniae TaxID=1343394 RepID=UPI0025401178|nr:uncharacterized protein N7477_004198 [Penicillium maclennaniae]KAJ5678565.1 hypothetical protein N7477_004198 [Penicillium maclennaniae]
MSDYTGPGLYQLLAAHAPNLAAAIEGESSTSGSRVMGWDKSSGGDHLKWVIAAAGNDEYFVLNYGSGLYMCTSADGKLGGQIVGNLIGAKSKLARWKIIPTNNGSGAYYLESVDQPDQCLAFNKEGTSNGTLVVQWSKSAQKNCQVFIRTPV